VPFLVSQPVFAAEKSPEYCLLLGCTPVRTIHPAATNTPAAGRRTCCNQLRVYGWHIAKRCLPSEAAAAVKQDHPPFFRSPLVYEARRKIVTYTRMIVCRSASDISALESRYIRSTGLGFKCLFLTSHDVSSAGFIPRVPIRLLYSKVITGDPTRCNSLEDARERLRITA
jgi:hypothetical protein